MVELEATVMVAKGRLLQEEEHLRGLADQLVCHARAKDVVGFLWIDRTFHLGIPASFGNYRLLEFGALLRDQARLPGIRHLAKTGAVLELANEPRALRDAVTAGDPAATARLMRGHLGHTRGRWAARSEEALDAEQPGASVQHPSGR